MHGGELHCQSEIDELKQAHYHAQAQMNYSSRLPNQNKFMMISQCNIEPYQEENPMTSDTKVNEDNGNHDPMILSPLQNEEKSVIN